MSDKDKDKEEDERDVGECEHQDPPEQPGAGLAAVQAFRISASSLLWTCPLDDTEVTETWRKDVFWELRVSRKTARLFLTNFFQKNRLGKAI